MAEPINLYDIADRINQLRCDVHNQEPNAIVENNDIKFNSCCDDFKEKVSAAMTEQIKENVSDMLKGLFKK